MKRHVEVRYLELEKLISDHVENSIGKPVKLSGLRFQEMADCSVFINWDMLKDIAIQVEFEGDDQ